MKLTRYGKFKVLTTDDTKTEDTYIYAEWENVRNKGKIHGFYWDNIGKDIITGTKIVNRFYVNDSNSLEQRLINDYYRPGVVYLYVDTCVTELDKEDIIDILGSMSKEEIIEYSKKVKEAKRDQREAAKNARIKAACRLVDYYKGEIAYNIFKVKSKILSKTAAYKHHI